MADGRVEVDARLNSSHVRNDVEHMNRELGRIGNGMDRTARDMRNTMGREMQGMAGDSEYYARKYRRAYGNEIGGLMHDIGGSMRYMSAETRGMMFEMMEGFHAQKMAMIPFKEDQIKATYGFYKMAQASKDFQGTNRDFINQTNEIGKAMKASQDAQINANRLAMMGMLETIGVMNAMSFSASKTTKNLDKMANPLYNTAKPALKLVDHLDRVARSGSSAQIALELHGPQASMKTLADTAMDLDAKMMGLPILAMGVGYSMMFMYGSLHKANMEMEPKYAEAFTNMMEKLTKALEPMRQAFTAVMVPIYNFVAKMAELTIAFNEAHPVMAKFIQGTIMLVPALMALMFPLALGVGYFRGLRAILFALRPLIMPIVTAFATLSTPVWIVAGAIAGVTVAFTHFYKTNEKFKGFVDGTIKSVKDFSVNLVKNGAELIKNAYNSDRVQNSIKTMQGAFVASGVKAKEFGLNMLNMGKYLYETAKSGDAMNEWVGHLPEPFQASAEKVGQSVANIRASILSSIPVIQSFGQNMVSMGKYLFYTALDGDYLNDWITHLPEPFQATAQRIGESVANIRESIIGWVSSSVAEGLRFGATMRDMSMYLLEVAKSGDISNESLMKLPVNMIIGVQQIGIALAQLRENFLATFPVIAEFGQNFVMLMQYILQVVTTGEVMNGWLTGMSGGFQNVAILIGTAIEQIKASIGLFVEAIRLAMGGDTSQLGQIFSTILPTLITLLIGGLPGLLITAMRFLPTIVEGINAMFPNFLATAGEILLKFAETIVGMLPTIVQIGIDIISKLVDGLVTALPVIVQMAIDVIVNTSNALMNGVIAMAPSIIGAGLDIIMKVCKGIADNLPKLFEMALQIIEKLLTGINNMLPKIIEAGIKILTELINGIVQRFPQWVQMAFDMMNKFLDSIIKHLPQILQTGIDILLKLIDGIVKMLPKLLDMAIKLIITLAKGIVDNLPTILEKGIQILEMLIRGIANSIPKLVVMALKLIVEFAKVIIQNLPQIIVTGVQLLLALIEGILKTIGRLTSTLVVEVFGAIKNSFKDAGTFLLGAGKDIMNGLINGIKSKLNSAKEVVGDVASSIKKTITNFFDIHSPSRVMRADGGFITMGLGLGIGDKAKFAINKAKSLAEAVMDGFEAITEDIQMGDIIGGAIKSDALASSLPTFRTLGKAMQGAPASPMIKYIIPSQEAQAKPPEGSDGDKPDIKVYLGKKEVGEGIYESANEASARRQSRLDQFKATPAF
ncbi:carbamoyl-phosphate synthase large subunit [Bacillus thuringiensis]|nr:carbamoyl-phosphate synthase large subunit [Bacillus thuringiensis]